MEEGVRRVPPQGRRSALPPGEPRGRRPEPVIVVAGFPSGDAAQAFASNPELPEKMKDAGVVGMPRIEMYEEVEAVQY
jgi:hypothetical protein